MEERGRVDQDEITVKGVGKAFTVCEILRPEASAVDIHFVQNSVAEHGDEEHEQAADVVQALTPVENKGESGEYLNHGKSHRDDRQEDTGRISYWEMTRANAFGSISLSVPA